MHTFSHDVRPFGLVIQTTKSGFVANTSRGRARFAKHVQTLGLRSKKAMRNLGHEMHGTRVFRIQEKARLRTLQAKRRKIWGLKNVAGEAVKTLWRTGLLPAAGHGAGVSGIADSGLREFRTFAGGMAGAKPKTCLTLNLSTQPDVNFDPVFDCTDPIVVRYASFPWDGKIVPSRLYRAWCSIKGRFDNRASWAGARGPISAVWLSLLRVGWGMASPVVLRSDQGDLVDLLKFCPWDVRRFVEEGIRRWQSARILEHLPNGSQESCWRRAMRHSVLRIRDASRRGALRALWAAGVWTPVRLHSIQLRPTPECFVCRQCPGTEAHQWFVCPAVLDVPDDERPTR